MRWQRAGRYPQEDAGSGWTASERNSGECGIVGIPMTALAQDVPPIPPAPVAPALAATTQSVPRTAEEVAGLRAQRTELSDQLQSAARRRSSIAETMQDASAAELPGLQARLQLLDSRILQIESDIDRTGQLIAQAPGQFLAETDGPNFGPFVNTGPNMRPDFTAITIVITLFVVAPIAFAYARNVWRRGSLASAPPVIARCRCWWSRTARSS